jgi:hypothetical protein
MTETPDEIMRRAHKQINAALAQELLTVYALPRLNFSSD